MGSLLYLTITKPNIVYVVGVMSQFMESPCVGHLIVVKRILQYVKGTLEYGLFYKENLSFFFYGCVDVDWVRNVIDRRSTSGYCFSIGFSMISSAVKGNKLSLSQALKLNMWQPLLQHKNVFGLKNFFKILGLLSIFQFPSIVTMKAQLSWQATQCFMPVQST